MLAQCRIPGRAWERGTQVVGANPAWMAGSAGSFSASPSANPAGRRKRFVRAGTLACFASCWCCSSAGLRVARLRADTPTPAGTRRTRRRRTRRRRSRSSPGTMAKLLPDGRRRRSGRRPAEVQQAIWAANKIIGKPYSYGGGHAAVQRRGYDCSGTVSYALHGGGLLTRPLDSGSFMRWGKRGTGSWITVYTNPGHAYAVIAGLRLDTSAAGDRRRPAAARAGAQCCARRAASRRATRTASRRGLRRRDCGGGPPRLGHLAARSRADLRRARRGGCARRVCASRSRRCSSALDQQRRHRARPAVLVEATIVR